MALLNRSEFNKSFSKLFSTSMIVALISALCVPIISRIYSPEELGLYQLLLSVVLVFSSVGSFKYEMAMVLPKYKYQKKNIFQVSFICLLISTSIYVVSFYFLSNIILEYFNAGALREYTWLISVAIFVSGLSQLAQMCLVADGEFNQLSLNNAAYSVSNNSTSIGLGCVSPSFSSLVVSYIASFMLTNIMAFYKLRESRYFSLVGLLGGYNVPLLLRVAKKYRKFPTINTANVVLNVISINLPIFVLSKQYTFEVVGLFMMANRLLDMPISIISGPLSQVYTKFAADDYKVSAVKLRNRFLSSFKKLALVSMLYFCGVATVYFIGVDTILGVDWKDVNVFLIILVFYKCCQLCTSPLGYTLSLINRQEVGFVIFFVFSCIRYLALVFADEPISSVINYTVVSSVFYAFYGVIMFKLIK